MKNKAVIATLPTECLKIILKPIMRFCLRYSVKLQEIIECAKSAMIEVAKEEMEKSGTEVSISRLSVMTGVHRPDVVRLYKEQSPNKISSNQITRVIGQWQQDEKFLTAAGKPRVLSVQGKDSEFVDLVYSVSADLNPYTVLFELERIGAVEKTERGLKLISFIYKPTGQVKEGFELLAKDTEDLLLSVSENIYQVKEQANLHIRTEYDNISPDALTQIRKWFLEQGSIFHRNAREFLSKFDRDINPEIEKQKPAVKVSLGTFSRISED